MSSGGTANPAGSSPKSLPSLKHDACRGGSHFAERLAQCGEKRMVISGQLDTVRSHDRNVLRNPQVRIAEGANRGHIVEANS